MERIWGERRPTDRPSVVEEAGSRSYVLERFLFFLIKYDTPSVAATAGVYHYAVRGVLGGGLRSEWCFRGSGPRRSRRTGSSEASSPL